MDENSGTSSATLTVSLTDVNDLSPEFTQPSYTATALETGNTGKLDYTATSARPLDKSRFPLSQSTHM